MSNSDEKLLIEVLPLTFNDGQTKNWVKVTLMNGYKSFVPSFEDLYRIIQAISQCEDEKYPYGAGRRMVFDFLRDCVYSHDLKTDFSSLVEKYNIPRYLR